MPGKWWIAVCLAMGAAAVSPAPPSLAAEDLVFQGDAQGMPLMKLIETARDVTKEPFFFDPKDLKDENVYFTGTVTVPRDRFLPFFDWCLRENQFVHLEQPSGAITLHRIRKLGQQARGQQALKSIARTVTPAELPAYADRNTLITTTWQGKNLPVREAVTTMQLYFADSATESIRNVEGTNAIVMTGFAANVVGVVQMLERLDAANADDPQTVQARKLEQRVVKIEEQLAELLR